MLAGRPCRTLRQGDAADAGVHFESRDVETNKEKGQENRPKIMNQKEAKGGTWLAQLEERAA